MASSKKTKKNDENIQEVEINKKAKVKEKNENKTKNQLYENNTVSQENEMSKLLKIVLIVTGIMIVFYGITLLVTKKSDETLEEQTKDEQTVTTEIQYDNIMIGTMLNYGGTYYVLIEQKDDNRLVEYESFITTILSSEDAPTIYKANLTDSFNKNYLGKEQNYYVENMADFRVTGTTLVKVKDGKIDSVSDSHETIKKTFKELI